jgi:DNA-binding transcriptional LysR family regulator
MDLRRLQVFAKVYERRSFSRAAEEVLLSQPTVSGHIKSLEEEVGVSLFDRLGREIIPTRAAELLYGYATRILETVDEAGLALDAFLGRLRGSLVAGGSTIPAHYLLPGLVGRFRLLHPEVRVTVEVGDTREVARRTLAGDLELGVVGAPPADERLGVSPLAQDVVACAAWPDHPLAGRACGPAELVSEPLILREPGSGTRAFVERALREAGVGMEELTVAAQMGSTLAVIMGVRARVGLGFVSRRALVDEVAAGRLVELELGGLELTRHFYLITRKGRTHSPAARAFMALLLAESGQDREAA